MKTLSDLTPAETLLLTTGQRVRVHDLLKVTFMDLLLKRSLKVIEVPNGASATTTYSNSYVVVGENYSYTNALPHEQVFLRSFHRDEAREILFNNLVKIGYNYAGSEKAYNKLVRDTAALSGCFTSGIAKIFSPFELSDYGQKVATELKGQLVQLSGTLPDLMEHNQEKALEVMKHIKGNIFLVKGIDFKRMAQIETAIHQEIYSNYSKSNAAFEDPSMWLALDLSSRRFDSSCSGCSSSDYSNSLDVGSDSGCSGDGGCSGCGGGD